MIELFTSIVIDLVSIAIIFCLSYGKFIQSIIEAYETYGKSGLAEFFKEPKDDVIIKCDTCLGSALILMLILFIVVKILTRKIKVDEYVKETNGLLDPIMAETIIDRKIGVKELIMSCIVDLIYRKKLKNIGNDVIEVVDLSNISIYEKKVVDLIFNGKKKIRLEDLKLVFLNQAKETKIIYEKFEKIKQEIEEKLYKNKIYSKIGDTLLKVIKIFSIIISIILLNIIGSVFVGKDFIHFESNIIIIWCIILLMRISKVKIENKNNVKISKKFKMYVLTSVSSLIFIIIFSLKNHILMIIGIIITLIFNIVLLKKNDAHVFTKLGKKEYAKIAGLKKYIIDYSLMSKRDLDSIIIWDKYLAYAVAFGISNKVSRKFNESLLEVSVIINEIDGV